eukprot:2391404-Rhodomonas_salina.1
MWFWLASVFYFGLVVTVEHVTNLEHGTATTVLVSVSSSTLQKSTECKETQPPHELHPVRFFLVHPEIKHKKPHSWVCLGVSKFVAAHPPVTKTSAGETQSV